MRVAINCDEWPEEWGKTVKSKRAVKPNYQGPVVERHAEKKENTNSDVFWRQTWSDWLNKEMSTN